MNTATPEVREKLKKIPLFKKIVDIPNALDFIIEGLVPTSVKKGEEIIKEGATGAEMFILLKGEIEILKFTMEKEPYTVAKLKAEYNIFFGELALVDTDKRSASVVALTDCELLVFTRDKFLELCQNHADIGWRLALEISGILSSRLRKANEEAVILFEALVNELKAS